MLNFGFALLKNLAKIVVDKTVGAIQHKMEKDKIVRAKEIEAKNVSIEQIKSAKGSIKDDLNYKNNNNISCNILANYTALDGERF